MVEFRPHVDQHITATDEIQVREWRVFSKILASENAPVPYSLADLIIFPFLHKKLRQTLGRDRGARRRAVDSRTRSADGRFADVRSKELKGDF